jgi:hypothetical protein
MLRDFFQNNIMDIQQNQKWEDEAVSHVPFHFERTGPNPVSLKLSDSGRIPICRKILSLAKIHSTANIESSANLMQFCIEHTNDYIAFILQISFGG